MKKVLLSSLMIIVVLAACSKAVPPLEFKVDTLAGKKLVQETCLACHGLDGEGVNDDIPNLAAQHENYLNTALTAYKDGKRNHAALNEITAKMTSADISNISAYFSGLPPIVSKPNNFIDIREQGQAAAANCMTCHGENGNSVTPTVPGLSGQQPEYFISAIKDYLDGKREFSSKEKQDMMAALNKVDIEAMALFFASQTPNQREAPSFGNVAAGQPLSANCGECHGAYGISRDPKVPNLAAQEAKYLVNAITAYRDRTRKQEAMHTFLSNISDKGILNIAAYYSVQQAPAAQIESFTMKNLAEKCDRCHDVNIDNPMMIVPKINGQKKNYIIKTLHAYQDNSRKNSPMHKMSLPYGEAVIVSIASWYANQPAK